jgi:hypothetical protein
MIFSELRLMLLTLCQCPVEEKLLKPGLKINNKAKQQHQQEDLKERGTN